MPDDIFESFVKFCDNPEMFKLETDKSATDSLRIYRYLFDISYILIMSRKTHHKDYPGCFNMEHVTTTASVNSLAAYLRNVTGYKDIEPTIKEAKILENHGPNSFTFYLKYKFGVIFSFYIFL
jgi:hypothetical protein